jgi:hypothetical protein
MRKNFSVWESSPSLRSFSADRIKTGLIVITCVCLSDINHPHALVTLTNRKKITIFAPRRTVHTHQRKPVTDYRPKNCTRSSGVNRACADYRDKNCTLKIFIGLRAIKSKCQHNRMKPQIFSSSRSCNGSDFVDNR